MIDALETRIRNNVPELKLVGEMMGFQTAVENKPKAHPACFVIPMEERPTPSEEANELYQYVRVQVGLIFVVSNVSDTTGAAARVTLDDLRKKVKEQVYGWQPLEGYAPLERGNSHLLSFRDGQVWWQDIYITSYYDRSIN